MAKTPNDTQTLLTDPGDTARILGISRAQLYKLDAMGKLPMPVRLGTRAPRWRVDELKAWLAAGCPARDKWASIAGGGR